MTHPLGPKVIVTFWKWPDVGKFGATLAHEITHGFMHRYRSGAALPLWADEGFADYVAARIVPNSPVAQARLPGALRFIRTGGPVDNILDMECIHDAWPGPYQVGYGVSYLLVRMMFEADPNRFRHWINAIKDGKDWEQALQEDFGMSRQRLVELFMERYREPN